MRIIIDIQGMQTASRFRGIGRYIKGLVKGIIAERDESEVYLLYNGGRAESIDEIHNTFCGIILIKDSSTKFCCTTIEIGISGI